MKPVKISHMGAKLLFKFPALFMFPTFDLLTPFFPFLPFMYKCELRVFFYFSYERFI